MPCSLIDFIQDVADDPVTNGHVTKPGPKVWKMYIAPSENERQETTLSLRFSESIRSSLGP